MNTFIALLIITPIIAGAIAFVIELCGYDNGHIYNEDQEI